MKLYLYRFHLNDALEEALERVKNAREKPLCDSCGVVIDTESDDFETCTSCECIYCEQCVEIVAVHWYDDASVIPWIETCTNCNQPERR